MEAIRALEGRPRHTNENPTEFVKALLVKLSDMLDSSNFIRLFHRQSFALYGIRLPLDAEILFIVDCYGDYRPKTYEKTFRNSLHLRERLKASRTQKLIV